MRYLFIVQGEGRGHLTQALALSDILRKNGHEVIKVLVGTHTSREIPGFFTNKIGAEVKTFTTPSFSLKKDKKRINWIKTIALNFNPVRIIKFLTGIRQIRYCIKHTRPDLIVNFYEMLTGFSQVLYRDKTPLVTVGHQFLINYPDSLYGKNNACRFFFLSFHARLTNAGADKTLALSFYPIKNASVKKNLWVVPPLLRKEVLELKPFEGDYLLGYILNEGYEEEVRAWHKENPEIKLKFFWDKKGAPEELKVDDTLSFYTLDDRKFLHYMAGCKGYISTAGFESICEAFYLNKPAMVIPAHIEQELNALDALSTGKCIVSDRFDMSLLLDFISEYKTPDDQFIEWVNTAESVFLKQLTLLPEKKLKEKATVFPMDKKNTANISI